MGRALSPLRHRAFRLLVGGQLASNLGDAFYAVALPWYVLSAHAGALLLGIVLAAYGISRTAVLALGTHLGDRWRPWTVMMSADLFRAVAAGGFAVIAALIRPQVEVLAPIALMLGAGEGLFLPASFSIVPSLVPDEDLQPSNALSSANTQVALILGPAIAGAVVGLLGSTVAFAADSLSSLISAITLMGIRATRAQPHAGPTRRNVAMVDASPSFRSLFATEPVLWIIFTINVIANLGMGGMSEVALPALARGPFGASATSYGLLLVSFGAGGLAGTLLAARTPDPRRPVIVASGAFGLQAILMAITPYLGGTIPAAMTLAGTGGLNGFANVLTLTAIQRWAPPHAVGRIISFLMLGSFGIFPVSVALAGVVVHNLGPVPFFPLAASATGLALLAGLLSPQWRNFGARTGQPAEQRMPSQRELRSAIPHD